MTDNRVPSSTACHTVNVTTYGLATPMTPTGRPTVVVPRDTPGGPSRIAPTVVGRLATVCLDVARLPASARGQTCSARLRLAARRPRPTAVPGRPASASARTAGLPAGRAMVRLATAVRPLVASRPRP